MKKWDFFVGVVGVAQNSFFISYYQAVKFRQNLFFFCRNGPYFCRSMAIFPTKFAATPSSVRFFFLVRQNILSESFFLSEFLSEQLFLYITLIYKLLNQKK
jgi:hypothetical protein